MGGNDWDIEMAELGRNRWNENTWKFLEKKCKEIEKEILEMQVERRIAERQIREGKNEGWKR